MKGSLGAVLTLQGTALATGYTASAPQQFGRGRRMRFWVHSVRSLGSGATTTTVKLQARYNDGSVQTGYVDLPSTKDDASATLEVEHAFPTGANATTENSFFLDRPDAIADLTVNLKVNAAGQAGDSTSIYASVV